MSFNTLKYKPLKEYSDIIMGQSPPSSAYNDEEKGLPFFQGKADFTEKYPVIRKWTTSTTKAAIPDDILMSVRAPVGPTNICKVKSCIGRGLAAIRCKEKKADCTFIWFYLKGIENRIAQKGVGSTFQAINRNTIEELLIPDIDINTQRKIASLLEQADSARQKRKEAMRLADEILKSVFIEMFGDPVRNEKGWEKGKLSDVPIEIIDGDRGVNYPKQTDFLEEGYCLFLNTGNVTKTGFNFHNLMYVSKEKDNQLRKGKLRRNDLILTTRGTVGNVAFYDKSVKYENIRINSGMVILRPDIRTFNMLYLYGCFSSDYFKRQMEKITSGCAQPQLPIRSLKNIEVIMPPVALQKKYAVIVEKIENLREKQLQSEKEFDNLFNSLMQRVFGGRD